MKMDFELFALLMRVIDQAASRNSDQMALVMQTLAEHRDTPLGLTHKLREAAALAREETPDLQRARAAIAAALQNQEVP